MKHKIPFETLLKRFTINIILAPVLYLFWVLVFPDFILFILVIAFSGLLAFVSFIAIIIRVLAYFEKHKIDI